MPKLNEMKQLPECMSPLSWMFCAVCVVPTTVIILGCTLKEFVIFFVVDWIAFFLIRKPEAHFFQKIYPETKLYFLGIRDSEIENLSSEKRVELLESFLRFPSRRAIYATVGSFIKVIPAFIVWIFVWKHPGVSNWNQFLLSFGITLINFSFFYGGVFLDSHIFISNLIRDIHRNFDFSEAFLKLKVTYSKSDFKIQENLAQFSIFFFILTLQWVLIMVYPFSSQMELVVKVSLVNIAGLVLFTRLWYLSQNFFVGGLETLFESMGHVDFNTTWNDLSIHTSPLLARFEKTFNLLSSRVRRSEQELSVLVTQEAEKSRYRAIGEMSALVAHDLAGPLHFIQFCVDQIQMDPSPDRVKKYKDRLSVNVSQAVQLLEALKARLKNPTVDASDSNFVETHMHVQRVLETQFHDKKFKSVQFVLDPALDYIRVKLSRVDLTHILDNLYRNSVKNLLENQIENPRIEIRIIKSFENHIEIHIADNGTGLTSEKFEQLTAYHYTRSKPESNHQGLGLRLTRRLIEYRGGQLNVIDNPDTKGTTYWMWLPIEPKKTQERILDSASGNRVNE